MNKSASEPEPLKHTGGVSSRLTVEGIQAEEVRKLGDPSGCLRMRKIVERCEESEIVMTGEPAVKAFFDTGIVADMRTSSGRIADDVVAGNFNSTTGRNKQSSKDTQQRRLSRSVFAHKGDRLSGLDRKRNSSEGAQRLAREWVP